MKKKCNVVMIATDKTESYLYTNPKGILFHNIRNTVKRDSICNPQHLYILSDDEIKEGDWFMSMFLSYPLHNIQGGHPDYPDASGCKKIIATTDHNLTKNISRPLGVTQSLPSIPQSFIDKYVSEYNAGRKIESVMVEYDEHYNTGVVDCGDEDLWDSGYSDYTLKLNDNTIIIHSIKDSWNRQELIKTIREAIVNPDTFCTGIIFDNNKSNTWIETNL